MCRIGLTGLIVEFLGWPVPSAFWSFEFKAASEVLLRALLLGPGFLDVVGVCMCLGSSGLGLWVQTEGKDTL